MLYCIYNVLCSSLRRLTKNVDEDYHYYNNKEDDDDDAKRKLFKSTNIIQIHTYSSLYYV